MTTELQLDVFSKEHKVIGAAFLEKVQYSIADALKGSLEIIDYRLSNNPYAGEAINIKLTNGLELTVTIKK